MQRSAILVRLGHSLLLCGIPALAVIAFGPDAWSATTTAPPMQRAATVREPNAAPLPDGHGSVQLPEWQETASSAMILVSEAHSVSAANNKALRQLRALLKTLQPGSLDHALSTQSFLLTVAQRDAWDSNWRNMGRHGADLRLLSRSLLNLRIQFLAANASLQSMQAQERASGSVFSFTPSVF